MIHIKTIASGSSGNCYLLNDGKAYLLLECGIPIKKIMEGVDFKLSDVDACLVTHEHGDHAKSVKDMVERGIRTYGPVSIAEKKDVRYTVNFTSLHSNWTFYLPNWTVRTVEAFHDVPCLAYIISSEHTKEVIFYCTDTCYIHNKIAGVNYLITECNYDPDTLEANLQQGEIHKTLRDRIIKTHLGLENVINMIDRNGWGDSLMEVHLVHLSESNANWEYCRKLVAKVANCKVFLPEI